MPAETPALLEGLTEGSYFFGEYHDVQRTKVALLAAFRIQK
jgi:hypothetical protein